MTGVQTCALPISMSAITGFTKTTDFVGSGNTNVTVSGNTVVVYSPTGGTAAWGNISGTLSGQTDLWSELQGKALNSNLTGLTETVSNHTGDTSIHYPMSAITITESQVQGLTTELNALFNGITGNTEQINLNIEDINDNYDLITGLTETVNANIQQINNNTEGITGLTETLESHTGNTNIHYVMSAITINESQVTGLVTDLTNLNNGITGNTESIINLESDVTGLTSNFDSHTGNTNIHYPMSAITITESQISDLKDYALNSTVTGLTANFNTYTGTTAPATFAPIRESIVSLTANTTIDASYENKKVECNGTFTVTLPNSLSTGFEVDFVNVGTGVITFAATTTLQSKGSAVTLASQYGGGTAYHRGSNVWLLVGDLT